LGRNKQVPQKKDQFITISINPRLSCIYYLLFVLFVSLALDSDLKVIPSPQWNGSPRPRIFFSLHIFSRPFFFLVLFFFFFNTLLRLTPVFPESKMKKGKKRNQVWLGYRKITKQTPKRNDNKNNA